MKQSSYLKNWLNKPYSYREGKEFQLYSSFIIGFIVFIILYILKPFGLGIIENNLLFYFAGYGIITTLVMLAFFFILTPIFPNVFNDSSWTVKKEILTIGGVIFVIGSITWLYHKSVVINNPAIFNFLFFLKYSFILGVFPVIIYVYFSEMFLNKERGKTSKKVKDKFRNYSINAIDKKNITIFSSNKNSYIEFNINNLLYINSEGNYITFNLIKNNLIEEKVLRAKMIDIEKELGGFDEIIRCHKSYIVNTNHISNITGNARGYYFHFSNYKPIIPISRKFKKEELIALIS